MGRKGPRECKYEGLPIQSRHRHGRGNRHSITSFGHNGSAEHNSHDTVASNHRGIDGRDYPQNGDECHEGRNQISMRTRLQAAFGLVSSALGAAPAVSGESESELTGTITELFPVVITFIVIILILSVLAGMFNTLVR